MEPVLPTAQRHTRRTPVFLAEGEMARPKRYPRLFNMSAGHFYDVLPKPDLASPPEYVYVPLTGLTHEEELAAEVMIAQWNLAWEAAQVRSGLFRRKDVPPFIRRAIDVAPDDANIVFLPQTRLRYLEYAPIYHLIPAKILRAAGLPLLAAANWPHVMAWDAEQALPRDFETRLGRAFAQTLWPRLRSGGRMKSFSESDPVKLLAHNLDFWLPAVHRVLHVILESWPRGPIGSTSDPKVIERVRRAQQSLPAGMTAVTPRVGGDFWRGEAEASEVLDWVVEEADSDARLRSVIDAIRSNRVHDDFSPHWSTAREDFERKLNHKRAKIKVTFVELPGTIPVHGAYSEVEDRMVFGDFMALLDAKERRIAVLLWSGETRLVKIAASLGYKNHSPVSKRLDRIRAKARDFFDTQ